ncbi:hypothetical protein JVX93_07720 [Mycolicibacterium boenickei]|nr:hypothetical protein JVX93_07720 [Mycolicibacterium boenickei]
MLKRFAAAALALGAVLATAGVAHADDMVVRDANGIPWSWPTEASCIKDGPDQHLQNTDDDAFLKYWYCVQHDDGLWYLHNTDSPTDRVN